MLLPILILLPECATVLVLFIHLIVTVLRLAMPRGAGCVVAESVLVKHQLLILNRGRKRAPNLRPADRTIAGLCTFFMGPSRLLRSAIVLRPATLLASPQCAEETKVPLVVFFPARGSARTEGTERRTHQCRRGNETT